MCGIFAYVGRSTTYSAKDLNSRFQKIKHRGPDDTQTVTFDIPEDKKLFFGFHRLAINGLDSESNQPLEHNKVFLMCNGEIYNCQSLKEKYRLKYKTNSDCEVILHLYHRFGFEKTVKMLDGVFSIILYDTITGMLYIANDPIGIRPLYWGTKDIGELYFASEPCAISNCDYIDFFQPGSFMCLRLHHCKDRFALVDVVQDIKSYYQYDFKPKIFRKIVSREEEDQICTKYRQLLSFSVQKRLMSDRPIASLLSGGLDSSLVSALLAKYMGRNRLHTFSIGLKGSPDLYYAQMVADHIKSVHHHVELSESDFLDAIPEVVKAIQSWDITTVRASVGNFLIAKYISETTDFKVIFNGDVSEEINASYAYSKFAPTPMDFFRDNVKLIKEVHQYDVLRSARCIEYHSMEARTPFADKDLVNFVMEIDPRLKMVGKDYQPIEKYLLRKAFSDTDILPKEVLWRPKEAFSDGVSKKSRSWHDIITEWVEERVSDKEFLEGKEEYKNHYPPPTKEAYLYRKLFSEIFEESGSQSSPENCAMMIKGYWMPRFIEGITDPSARVLPKASS